MDIQLRRILRQLVNKVHAFRQIGQNLAPRLHQRGDGLQIDRGIRDNSLQNRLGLGKERLGAELFHVFRVHPAQLVDVEHGRGLRNAGDIKNFSQLGERVEFALCVFALRAPAQKCHIIEHSLGQITLADEILIARVAVALGHFVLCVTHDRGAVDIRRDLPAEGLVQQIVFGCRGQIFAAAHDMRDAHQMIVDDVREVIRRQTVGFQQHLILQLLVFHGDIAEGRVMEGGRALVRDALADDEGLAGLHALFCLLERQIAAGADVLFDLAGRGFALVLVGFLAEAVIRAALFAQQLRVLAEQLAPLGLDIRADGAADVGAFVVIKAAFGHGLVDDIDRALDQTALIGILDAENEFAVVAAGDQPGIERRAQVADVHIARGARSEARADLAMRDARFHLLKKIHDASSSNTISVNII